MGRKIEIELNEAKDLFLFLEDLNAFFHQPMHYENLERIERYIDGMYPNLHRMFYEVVWNRLPPDVQKEIEDRPSPFVK